MTVTVQALGWWAGRMFQPLIEEINFVVFWYRTQPQVSVIEEPGPEGGVSGANQVLLGRIDSIPKS
ncbi:MAG: hypothetical protein OTJ43_07975 [Dehalococcoidia bacterium]|nr:hypothetical protein [Dehalococcoidia bacterium]